MEKSNKVPKNGQGPMSQEIDEKIGAITIEQVEQWLLDDLGRARSLLQAIHNDKNVQRLIAVHLHGLAQNYKNAQMSLETKEA